MSKTDNIDVLIEAGNSFFKASNYDKAIKAYTEAIDKSANTNSRAYSNRSAVYSKQNKCSLAYEDALKAIDLGEHLNEKTLFRAGKSAYAMRQYQTAFTHYDACSKINPQNEEAMRELTRTTQRLLESSTGKFDLAALTKEMFRRVAKRETLNFDCADFKSSQISIENIENKSKGVIANDMMIKKGTLLCASKALSAVFKYTLDGVLEDTDMFANLIAQMPHDPYLTQQVYSLCPGAGFSRDADELSPGSSSTQGHLQDKLIQSQLGSI
jgi:tetratricopeptide (TPR) repeat protein